MGFLSSIWNAITYVPRQVINVASNTVSGVLNWGANTVGNVLQGLGVTGIMTPFGGATIGGQQVTQPGQFNAGVQQPSIQPQSGFDWSKILLYGGIAVAGIVVLMIVLKLVKK